MPGALSYKIYRGTSAGGETGYFTSLDASVLRRRQRRRSPARRRRRLSTTATGVQTTIPIDVTAAASVVEAALAALPSIGVGNVHVDSSSPAATTRSTFIGALARHRRVALLVGNVSSVRSNGVHAIATLDGGADPDTYDVNLIGGSDELARQRLRLRHLEAATRSRSTAPTSPTSS